MLTNAQIGSLTVGGGQVLHLNIVSDFGCYWPSGSSLPTPPFFKLQLVVRN